MAAQALAVGLDQPIHGGEHFNAAAGAAQQHRHLAVHGADQHQFRTQQVAALFPALEGDFQAIGEHHTLAMAGDSRFTVGDGHQLVDRLLRLGIQACVAKGGYAQGVHQHVRKPAPMPGVPILGQGILQGDGQGLGQFANQACDDLHIELFPGQTGQFQTFWRLVGEVPGHVVHIAEVQRYATGQRILYHWHKWL